MDEWKDKPEESKEPIGTESREVTRYKEKLEELTRQEKGLYNCVHLLKAENKKIKHLQKKSRDRLLGLTESFYDEIKTSIGDSNEQPTSIGNDSNGIRKLKKRRRYYRLEYSPS